MNHGNCLLNNNLKCEIKQKFNHALNCLLLRISIAFLKVVKYVSIFLNTTSHIYAGNHLFVLSFHPKLNTGIANLIWRRKEILTEEKGERTTTRIDMRQSRQNKISLIKGIKTTRRFFPHRSFLHRYLLFIVNGMNMLAR